MSSLAVHDVLKNRVLVTRASARGLAPAIESAIRGAHAHLQLDFSRVDGITPSFLDELLSVVEEAFARMNLASFRVEVLNPPTALSSKFAAIGRGRELSFTESSSGWLIERQRRVG